MRKFRRALMWALGLVLSTAAIVPASGEAVPDEQYAGVNPPERAKGTIGAIYDPSREDSFGSSFLFAGDPRDSGQVGWAKNAVTCTSALTPECASDRQIMEYQAYLQECTANVASDCVVSVTAIRTDGTEIPGSFVRRVPAVGPTEFEGNPARKIPNGRTPGLWTFADIAHQGGRDFLVSVSLAGRSDKKEQNPEPGQLRMAVFPVSSVTPAREGGVMKIGANKDGSFSIQGAFDRSHVYHSPNEALNRWPMPDGLKFRVSVKLRNALTGWLHGRVFDPKVTITNDAGGQLITVEAAPVSVPVIDPWTKWGELPEYLRTVYSGRSPGGDFCLGWVEDKSEDLCINIGGNSSASEQTMREFLEWVKIAKDTAAATKTTWSIRSMRGDEVAGRGDCYQNDKNFVGFVATNSTVYLAGPPSFNRDAQSLDYKVASPHFTRTGGTNIGTYSLIIRSDVARCIYGFSNAPISATVSVLSADGAAQVATTSVAQKDGWLSLNAAGFTFSAPTVSVKLTQEQPAPVVVKPAAKKSTITCVKGKSSKKVTGTKCPTGWKKK